MTIFGPRREDPSRQARLQATTRGVVPKRGRTRAQAMTQARLQAMLRALWLTIRAARRVLTHSLRVPLRTPRSRERPAQRGAAAVLRPRVKPCLTLELAAVAIRQTRMAMAASDPTNPAARVRLCQLFPPSPSWSPSQVATQRKKATLPIARMPMTVRMAPRRARPVHNRRAKLLSAPAALIAPTVSSV